MTRRDETRRVDEMTGEENSRSTSIPIRSLKRI